MNIKVNLTKKLVETLTREIIAENKAKKALKEATLKPETEKMVQGIVNAAKKHEGEPTQVNENLISDDVAQLIMQIVVGGYGTAAAAMVGNLIYTGIKGGKEELKDAFKQIAADLREKHGGGIGGTKKGGGIAENRAKRMHEEVETLDPQVKDLVDKLAAQLDETHKTKMNESFSEYAGLIMQILAGAYGAAAVGYFTSLAALAFKKGGKEELLKAMKELEKAHRGGSLGGH